VGRVPDSILILNATRSLYLLFLCFFRVLLALLRMSSPIRLCELPKTLVTDVLSLMMNDLIMLKIVLHHLSQLPRSELFISG